MKEIRGTLVAGNISLDASLTDDGLSHLERDIFGFHIHRLFPNGLPREKLRYLKTESSIHIPDELQNKIDEAWRETVEKNPNAFDAPRARYEGSIFDSETGELIIRYSELNYRTHAYMRNTVFPKHMQANLWTINGVVLTSDNKIAIGIRNPEETDQGGINHIVPAGFVDMMSTEEGLLAEEPYRAAVRKLLDEITFPGNLYSETPHDSSERELVEELDVSSDILMEPSRLLAIVYNSRKNFDFTATMLLKVAEPSSELRLRGKEHEGLYFIDATTLAIESELKDLALVPELNSGHLRGDLAAMIAYINRDNDPLATYRNSLIEIAVQIAQEAPRIS